MSAVPTRMQKDGSIVADGIGIPPVRAFRNKSARDTVPGPAPDRAPLDFHRQLPGYRPTPLIETPDVAQSLGVERTWVKDESSRFGLPAFKILGASWATFRALQDLIGGDFDPAMTQLELREALRPHRPLTLAAATDGNHGRAVARIARWLDLAAQIYVPVDMTDARKEAIAGEGAELVEVHGTYDEAVALAAAANDTHCIVIADTSWAGYEQVPRWVIDGYSTIFWEVEDELAHLGEAGPDIVAVQVGVGALAAAATRHYRRPGLMEPPALVGVEPADAACLLASIEAGTPTGVPGPHRSIMAGLNCGWPSPVAWPIVSQGIDLLLAVDDDWTRQAMRNLAQSSIVAGETGAAGLAGLLALRADPALALERAAIRFGPQSRVLLIDTEGATDPTAYRQIVASPA